MIARLAEYDMVVQALVQDRAEKLTIDDRAEAIQGAVAEYSTLKPRVKRRTLSGSGTSRVSMPTSWSDDFSSVLSIEFPVNETPPTYLAEQGWQMYQSPTASPSAQLYWLGSIPGTGQTFNLAWTVPHVVSQVTGTIPTEHYRMVATLGAAHACLMLAGYYSQAGDPVISIDSQNPQSKAAEYRALAKELRLRYRMFFGLGTEASGTNVAAASIFGELDTRFQWGGPFFSHDWRGVRRR